MKTQTLLMASAITGALTLGTLAYAGPNCGKGGYQDGGNRAERMEKRFDRLATKLGLSDTQKTELKALKQNNRNDIKPLRLEKRELRKELGQLDPAASDYSAKLADIANRKAEIVRQITVLRGNKRKQMAQILTADQLTKFKDLRKDRKQRFHKKMRKHHKKQQQS